MVKSILSIIISLIFLTVGAYIEQTNLKGDFKDFSNILEILYEKIETQEATKEDVLSVQKWWIKEKNSLHIYIPHNDIKEIDMWLSETVSLVKTKDFNLALSKMEVLLEIAEHLPDTFGIKFENIL